METIRAAGHSPFALLGLPHMIEIEHITVAEVLVQELFSAASCRWGACGGARWGQPECSNSTVTAEDPDVKQ